MESLTSITLNLQNPNIATVTYGVQNDRLSRKITAQLVDGSTPWTPPAGALATIRFLKPDGTAGFYDTDEAGNPATVIDGSAVTMTIVEQALTVPGDVYMQLNFYTGAGERLTTFCWLLRVQQNVLTDATIISSDYYNILSAQIAAVLEAAAALTGLTATASGLPTGSAPTVDVTGGTGGVPYNLAFGLPAGPVGPSEVPTTTTEYQEGTSPTTVPTGTWLPSPPAVAQGAYLWTKITLSYSDGTDAVYYTVARQGVDGAGSPGTATPLPDSASGAVGTGTSFAREDHRHPYPGTTLQAAVQAISANGTFTFTLSGLTSDFVVANLGMFSDAACTTPIPENTPPCDITITKSADSWSCTIENFSATFYFRPTFILKQN